MQRDELQVSFRNSWVPFTLWGEHFCFRLHSRSRLEKAGSSHWGGAIYMWRGEILRGPQTGNTGILIGETKDLRARIKQYATGTQPKGNKYWREEFLELGDVYLHVLSLHDFKIVQEDSVLEMPTSMLLDHKNPRMLVEQMLILQAAREADDSTWVVNKID